MYSRLILIAFLALLSLVLLRLIPKQITTLAKLTPSEPLFYFQMHPRSLQFESSREKVFGQLGEEPERITEAIGKLAEPERLLVGKLLADPETNLAVAAYNFNRHTPDRIHFDFLFCAQTSRDRFPELSDLAGRWIGRAIPPAHYIEMQKTPRLGVLIGEPPRRLYVYEDYPTYAVSNSPDLITRLLEIRYKGHPALAGQSDFEKMERAVSGSEGALLYVSLADLVRQRDAALAVPLVSVLQALRINEWRSLGYHWSEVQGQLVQRTILIERR